MAACPAFDPIGPYVTGLTGFVDCQVRALGEDGYRSLGFGSPVGIALTGLLTIYIALIGYRMLFGEVPSVREGVVTAVKIGFVLALATQWPAYQTLVYNVAIDGPDEIADRIFAPGGLGGGDARALTDRVQGTYAAIEAAARPEPVASVEPVVTPTPQAGPTTSPQPPTPILKPAVPVDPTLGLAGQILLVASLAGLLSVRIIAGLMLALGPVFIACFLFGAMRGLFEGWVRVLVGSAIGAVGVGSVLAVELAILEPQVSALLQAREAQVDAPLLPGELLATTGLFALVLLFVLIATGRAAAGFRLPDAARRETPQPFEQRKELGRDPAATRLPSVVANDDRPRAQAIADAAAAAERREQRTAAEPTAPARRVAALGPTSREPAPPAPEPIGQRYRRTTTRRISASANRRDVTG